MSAVINPHDVIAQFKDFGLSIGITLPDNLNTDTTDIQTFKIDGKDKGRYKLHTDGIPAGFIQDWSGESHKWKYDDPDYKPPVLTTEQRNQQAKDKQAKNARIAKETADKNAAAAEKAAVIWELSSQLDSNKNHEYLVKKGITGIYSARINEYKGITSLVIPLGKDGKISTLQFINPDGSKKLLTGGQKSGCYSILNKMPNPKVIAIAEGYATIASILDDSHSQKIGYMGVMAIDAGNLEQVAVTMCKKYPQAAIILFGDKGDKDHKGEKSARAAAIACNGYCVLPPIEKGDFNDYLTGGAVTVSLKELVSAACGNHGELNNDSDYRALNHDELIGGYNDFQDTEQPSATNRNNDQNNADITPLHIALEKELFPDTKKTRDGLSILATVSNLSYLLKSYGMTAFYDEVAKSQELMIPNKTTLNHDLHNEASIQQLCNQAALNGISETIVNKLPIIITENTTNPVKDFIFSKKWDGISRINTLCNSLIVAPEHRELSTKIMKTWFIQCVAALDKAVIGCAKNDNAVAKYELVLTFQGIQGAAKTTWITKLLPRNLNGEIFSSRYINSGSTLQLDNKDSVKQNVSCWINELGELEGTFKKSEIAELKAFLSKQRDVIRLPYARVECNFSRSTSFCASVNDEQFLNDSTGSRRFGVIKIVSVGENKTDMQQLWAEVWELYASGAAWWLDKETETAMQLRNEQHQSINPIHDAILSKFDFESPPIEWVNKMTTNEIYQECFCRLPNKSEANAIKPFLTKLNVKIITPKNVNTFLMPKKLFLPI